MNDRIHKLAEQAGMNIKTKSNWRRPSTNIIGAGLVFGTVEGHKNSHINVEELEMFADLIIKECAELSTGYTGNVKLLIMNHFGMEP